jgi:hypothetical protein
MFSRVNLPVYKGRGGITLLYINIISITLFLEAPIIKMIAIKNIDENQFVS